jgi:hypothetical protein
MTIAFEPKTDAYNANLEILSTAQRKGCACGSSPETNDEN